MGPGTGVRACALETRSKARDETCEAEMTAMRNHAHRRVFDTMFMQGGG